jgi:hypothetical protein
VNKNLIGILVTVAVIAAIFVFHGKHRVPMSFTPIPPVEQVAPPVIETPVVAAPAIKKPPVKVAPPSDQGTAEQRAACMPDAFRLCSSAIPDRDKIIACMVENKSQLSPACRAMFAHPAPAGHRKAKPRARMKTSAIPCTNSWHPERCNNPSECYGVCLN